LNLNGDKKLEDEPYPAQSLKKNQISRSKK